LVGVVALVRTDTQIQAVGQVVAVALAAEMAVYLKCITVPVHIQVVRVVVLVIQETMAKGLTYPAVAVVVSCQVTVAVLVVAAVVLVVAVDLLGCTILRVLVEAAEVLVVVVETAMLAQAEEAGAHLEVQTEAAVAAVPEEKQLI
jgi:hypothetical protein